MRSLVERVKELKCLYRISKLFAQSDAGIETVADRALEIIRRAWQYPEITCVRIELGGNVYQTPRFRETPWRQHASIRVKGGSEGSITVVYLEDRPIESEGPFLREERHLLDAVARELGTVLRLKLLEKARRDSEQRYATLVENAGDGVVIVQNGIVRFANKAVGRMLNLADPNAITDRPLSEFISPGQVVEPERLFESTAAVRSSRGIEEIILRRADDSQIAVQIVANRIQYQGSPAVMAVIHDVTLSRHLEQQIVTAAERERAQIGRELHDGICQYLAGIAAAAAALEKELGAAKAAQAEIAHTIRITAEEAVGQTRTMARILSPITIAPEGLMSGLHDLAYQAEKLFGVSCRVTCPSPILIDNATTTSQLYRITQEAIYNAIKHGKARNIEISLVASNDRTLLQIRDDGVGIHVSARDRGGMGLKIMNHRARMIGAVVEVSRHPQGGTLVQCTFRGNSV